MTVPTHIIPHSKPISDLTPRRTPSISHQPRKSRNYVKIRKMGRKVNGISVSDTPKIGERPYPSPFHPVEITPKTGQIYGNPREITAYTPHKPNFVTLNHQITPKSEGKFRWPGLRNSSLEIGTRTLEAQLRLISYGHWNQQRVGYNEISVS